MSVDIERKVQVVMREANNLLSEPDNPATAAFKHRARLMLGIRGVLEIKEEEKIIEHLMQALFYYMAGALARRLIEAKYFLDMPTIVRNESPQVILPIYRELAYSDETEIKGLLTKEFLANLIEDLSALDGLPRALHLLNELHQAEYFQAQDVAKEVVSFHRSVSDLADKVASDAGMADDARKDFQALHAFAKKGLTSLNNRLRLLALEEKNGRPDPAAVKQLQEEATAKDALLRSQLEQLCDKHREGLDDHRDALLEQQAAHDERMKDIEAAWGNIIEGIKAELDEIALDDSIEQMFAAVQKSLQTLESGIEAQIRPTIENAAALGDIRTCLRNIDALKAELPTDDPEALLREFQGEIYQLCDNLIRHGFPPAEVDAIKKYIDTLTVTQPSASAAASASVAPSFVANGNGSKAEMVVKDEDLDVLAEVKISNLSEDARSAIDEIVDAGFSEEAIEQFYDMVEQYLTEDSVEEGNQAYVAELLETLEAYIDQGGSADRGATSDLKDFIESFQEKVVKSDETTHHIVYALNKLIYQALESSPDP